MNTKTRRLYDTFKSWAPKMTLIEEAALLDKGVTKREIKHIRQRKGEYDTPLIRMHLSEIRALRLGLWGICDICDGAQYLPNPNPAIVQIYSAINLYDEWVPIEPPLGEGWQLWDGPAPTGSPYSPICVSPEALAMWCAEDFEANYEEWLVWIYKVGNSAPTTKSFRLHSETYKVFMDPKKPTIQ